MAAKSQDLENQERGLHLATREPAPAPVTPAEDKAAALQLLRERIKTVQGSEPKDPAPHCSDCFSRGWRAAAKAIGEQ